MNAFQKVTAIKAVYSETCNTAETLSAALCMSRSQVIGIYLREHEMLAAFPLMSNEGSKRDAPKAYVRNEPVFGTEPIPDLTPPPSFVCREVSMIELEDNECRWPVGHLKFCGNTTTRRKTYCDYHRGKSFGLGTISEQNAMKGARYA